MKISNLRGTKDIFAEDINKFNKVSDCARSVAKSYMFSELMTPVIEKTELFAKNLGQESDILSKEIYSFCDKSGNEICLRPEFTASVARSFISNFQHYPLPVKLFSLGPLFRYDRPQKGRFRQFWQANFEIIGSEDIEIDIEIVLAASTLLKKLEIDHKLEINSLGCQETIKNYKSALSGYYAKYKNDLSAESKIRLEKNPLRILDSKDYKDCQINQGAPKISQYYTGDSATKLENFCSSISDLNIDFKINESLVRGLDYYSGMVFECKTQKLGAQDTLVAGGRYDSLIKNLGGKDTPAMGFAAGIDRIAELINAKVKEDCMSVSIIPIGETAEKRAKEIAFLFRQKNIKIDLRYNCSLKNRMKKAELSKFAVIFGDEEIKKDHFILKDMQTGVQKAQDIKSITKFLDHK